MDIRVLQYFLTVAREESITRAAEKLNMTQPPLSRQLQDLEKELGKQLFIRGKRIRLTEDGLLLRKRAEELVALMDKTKAELAATDENVSGEVYIGGGESDAIFLLARAAKLLQEDHPMIRYRLYSGDAEHVMERLDKGLIDFGLLIEPVDVSKYDYLRLPVHDAWGVLMRRDDPLARQKTIRAEDLWDKPLIVSHQLSDSSELSGWLKREISSLNVVARYNLIYNAAQFVRAGFGYTIGLDGLINTTGKSDFCFRPLSPKVEAGLCFAWKKNQVFSKPSELFLRRLQEMLADSVSE